MQLAFSCFLFTWHMPKYWKAQNMRPGVFSFSLVSTAPPPTTTTRGSCWHTAASGHASAWGAHSGSKVFGVDWVNGGSCSQYGFSHFPSHTTTIGLLMGQIRGDDIFFVILPIDRKCSEDFMRENLMWQQHCFLTLQLGLLKLNDLRINTWKGKMF